MMRSVIISAVRTPVGKYGSALRARTAVGLGTAAIHEAVSRAALPPDSIDYVVMGHVLQAGAGQITSRQAAIAAGIPQEVPALTPNNVCLSSLTAAAYADQMIRAGELDTVVAGGMESMSNAPYVLKRSLGSSDGGGQRRGRDDSRRAVVDVHRPAYGRVLRRGQRGPENFARGPRRVGGALAPARRERMDIGPLRTRDGRSRGRCGPEGLGRRPGRRANTGLRPP
jgi:acetyl-CoA acetyltransferase